jgi:two-component sensor histidine kinase/tetratricopeptide (TPR) repeat protein
MKNYIHQIVLISGFVFLFSLTGSGQSCEEVQDFIVTVEQQKKRPQQSQIDSLIDLENVFREGQCLDLLYTWSNTLFNAYSMRFQFREGAAFYEKAYEISKKSEDPDLIAQMGIAYAEACFVLERHPEVFQTYAELKDLDIQSKSLQSRIYTGYGKSLYFLERSLDAAIPHVEQALEWARVLNDSLLIKNAHEAMAVMYLMNGSLLAASKEYILMENYLPSHLYFPKAGVYNQLSEIFMELGDDQKAKYYANKTYEVAEAQQFAKTKARAQLNLARLASRAGEAQADSLFQAAIQYDADKSKSLFSLNIYYAYANHLIRNDRINEATTILEKVRSLPDKILNIKPRDLPFLEAEIGFATKNKQMVKAAIDSLEQKQIITESLLDQVAVSKLKSKYFDLVDNPDSAYTYAIATLNASEQLFEENRTRFIYDAESRYQKGKQDQKINDLLEKQELSAALLDLRKKQSAFMWLGIFTLLFISGWIFLLYRKNNKKSATLFEQNAIIKKTLSEKEILLKEIHHRVKNNLQIVSSLLSLQSRFIQDKQALSAITEGKNRVKSMALIHQNLYQENNLTGVAIKPYFEKLIRSLFNSYNIDPDQIKLKLKVDDLTLSVDTVIPIGLITNELVSNALKHAFPEGRKGVLSVKLLENTGRVILEVKDDGIGIEQPELLSQSNTFGYRIIQAFKEKLNSEMIIQSNKGTSIQLVISTFEKVQDTPISKVG